MRKSGEEVNFLKLYYLDKDSYEDSKDWKGYKIQNFDVLSQGFTLSDFVDGPGFYKVSYTPSLSRRGQVQPKLVSVEFVKSLDFPKSEGLLVLGVKRFEFTPENSTDLKRGLKAFAINPEDLEQNDFLGYPELSFTYSGKLQDFKSVPGFYNCDFFLVRGRGGDSLLRANKFTFLTHIPHFKM